MKSFGNFLTKIIKIIKAAMAVKIPLIPLTAREYATAPQPFQAYWLQKIIPAIKWKKYLRRTATKVPKRTGASFRGGVFWRKSPASPRDIGARIYSRKAWDKVRI